MKYRNLIVLLLLVVTMSVFNSASNIQKVCADELDEPVVSEPDEPYMFVSNASCTLSISSGSASVRSIVNGEYGTFYTSVTVYLERFENGSWQSYASWSHNGDRSLDNTDTTNVIHGIYRVWMSVSATAIGGSEAFNVDGNTAGY